MKISKAMAKKLYDHYTALIDDLLSAQRALAKGGVKSYTIGDRSLTKFDLPGLDEEIEDAVEKQAYYEEILNGRVPHKVVGVVPRDW